MASKEHLIRDPEEETIHFSNAHYAYHAALVKNKEQLNTFCEQLGLQVKEIRVHRPTKLVAVVADQHGEKLVVTICNGAPVVKLDKQKMVPMRHVDFVSQDKIDGETSFVYRSRYYEGNSLDKLIICEQLPDKHFFNDWLKYIVQIAHGLLEIEGKFPHGNLKLSKIYLRDDVDVVITGLGQPNVNKDDPFCAFETRAPEHFSINYRDGSAKGDMFSFGIIIWQFVYGARPFQHMHRKNLHQGRMPESRPRITKSAPEELKLILNDCWSSEPGLRPKISNVLKYLTNFFDNFENEDDWIKQIRVLREELREDLLNLQANVDESKFASGIDWDRHTLPINICRDSFHMRQVDENEICVRVESSALAENLRAIGIDFKSSLRQKMEVFRERYLNNTALYVDLNAPDEEEYFFFAFPNLNEEKKQFVMEFLIWILMLLEEPMFTLPGFKACDNDDHSSGPSGLFNERLPPSCFSSYSDELSVYPIKSLRRLKRGDEQLAIRAAESCQYILIRVQLADGGMAQAFFHKSWTISYIMEQLQIDELMKDDEIVSGLPSASHYEDPVEKHASFALFLTVGKNMITATENDDPNSDEGRSDSPGTMYLQKSEHSVELIDALDETAVLSHKATSSLLAFEREFIDPSFGDLWVECDGIMKGRGGTIKKILAEHNKKLVLLVEDTKNGITTLEVQSYG